MYTYIHIFICMYIRIFVYICRITLPPEGALTGREAAPARWLRVKTHVYIYIYIYGYLFMYRCVCIYVCMYVYVYTYICICVYICIYIYIYRITPPPEGALTDREAEPARWLRVNTHVYIYRYIDIRIYMYMCIRMNK